MTTVTETARAIPTSAVRSRDVGSSDGHLLVRASGRLVGLPLGAVVEVLQPGTAFPVPSLDASVRGVVVIRGRILSLVHLGALLSGLTAPDQRSDTGVVVELAGRLICFEVDDAEAVWFDVVLPVPAGAALPWAAAVARTETGLVPMLDLTALGARIMEAGAA